MCEFGRKEGVSCDRTRRGGALAWRREVVAVAVAVAVAA